MKKVRRILKENHHSLSPKEKVIRVIVIVLLSILILYLCYTAWSLISTAQKEMDEILGQTTESDQYSYNV